MIGRTVIGAGTYTDPVSGSVTRILGSFNGAEKHQLTADEIGNPTHSHNTSTITLDYAGEHKHYMFMKDTDPITFSVEQSNDITSLNPSYKTDMSWYFSGATDYGYYFYSTPSGQADAGASSISGAHSHTLTGDLANSTPASAVNKHNNMQPYLVQKWIVKI
jgi:microcystin-dependent protein